MHAITMPPAPTSPHAGTSSPAPCRVRDEIVEQELPELLAAFTAREDLRRRGAALRDLLAATDRLAVARTAVRAAC